jgi:hypothetical protein
MSEEFEKVKALEVEQLRVGKHFRIRNEHGTLTINSSKSILGIWLSRSRKQHAGQDIGMVLQPNVPPYFCVYPTKGFRQGGTQDLPFALSADGLQIPHRDGTVTRLSLEEVSDLVKKLKQ